MNMDMLKFFSNQYADRGALFEGLSIWNDEKYRNLQGKYPVIFLTFADIKADNYEESKNSVIACINDVYRSHRYLLKSNLLTEGEKELFKVLDEYANTLEPAFGPTVSGILVQFFYWKNVFVLLLILLLIAIIAGAIVIENVAPLSKLHLDIFSVVLSTAGLAAFLYGVSVVMR